MIEKLKRFFFGVPHQVSYNATMLVHFVEDGKKVSDFLDVYDNIQLTCKSRKHAETLLKRKYKRGTIIVINKFNKL